MKPLSERSEIEYARILKRARKPDGSLDRERIASWSRGQIIVLRAALRREAAKRASLDGLDDEDADFTVALKASTKGVPRPGDFKRKVTQGVSEEEAAAFEKTASELPPAHRAIVLIPLFMGLRSQELLGLSRDQIKNAIKRDELVVVRKGGNEAALPVSKGVKALFKALLDTPAAKPRWLDADASSKAWETVGEILTAGTAKTAYQTFRRLVQTVGKGIPGIKPHKLRHAFATRMHRDGAPLAAIQWALGHADLSTTMIYIHGDAVGGSKFFRDPSKR